MSGVGAKLGQGPGSLTLGEERRLEQAEEEREAAVAAEHQPEARPRHPGGAGGSVGGAGGVGRTPGRLRQRLAGGILSVSGAPFKSPTLTARALALAPHRDVAGARPSRIVSAVSSAVLSAGLSSAGLSSAGLSSAGLSGRPSPGSGPASSAGHRPGAGRGSG
jgi:hypothetical protein